MTATLLIVGASVRAAARSAQRAGLPVAAADLFADRDLAAICPATRLRSYGGDLEALLSSSPADHWMYAGGLENEPGLIERLVRLKPLLGNPAEVIRHVREPGQLSRGLAAAGLPAAETRASPDGLPRDGSWLVKPRRSCGGRNIAAWTGQELPAERGGWYLQRYVTGVPCSAVYLAAAGQAELVGVTRQLLGADWGAPGPFCYAGSLGPLRLDNAQLQRWRQIGNCLVSLFQLRGLFGVDAVVSQDDIYPVEVNPRCTASVEIIERGLSVNCLAQHVRACLHDELPPSLPGSATRSCGKAILYASADVRIGAGLERWARPPRVARSWPAVTDIPAAGSLITARHPVLTVQAQAARPEDVAVRLRRRLAALRRLRPTAAR
jgi:predicted ATP-grasp superfamily ATP-dependent carboligase